MKTALNTLSQVEDPIRRAYLAEECAEVFGLEKVIVSGELEKIADKHERRLYARKQTDSPVQEDLSDVPMPESLFGVDTWTVLKQAYVHVLQDDTGAAALAYLSLDFPSGGVPEWGIALRDDLRDWDEEHDRGNPPTPAAFVQARWYDRDDAYRRGVAELLNIQEGALVADHVRIVRDCHQRLEMVRNRRNDVEALRAHGRGQGGIERP